MKLPGGKVSAKEKWRLCSQGGGGVWDPTPPGVVGAQCLHELKFMEEISIDSY